MCTVTYIPSDDKIYLTSNRDEKHWRSAALPPLEYDFLSGKIVFPKDGDAGGTWIAVHENGNAVTLLNGAFEKHVPDPPYRKSRGVVLLELIQTKNPFDHFRSYNTENIEPFTLVIWAGGQLAECRWDGERKHARTLDSAIPHIWSSVTLYTKEAISKRQSWFDDWAGQQNNITLEKVLDFHQFAGDGDTHNDLLMNRDDHVFTVSITGIEISSSQAQIMYFDLPAKQSSVQKISFVKEPVANL